MIIFSIFEHFLNHISFALVLVLITLILITFLIGKIVELYNSSKKGIIVTFICITGLLITRWIDLGYFPLNNFSESLIFLSWSVVILYMYLFFKNDNFRIMTELVFIFIQIFASLDIFIELKNKSATITTILVPVLQSHWLMMHVSMILFGYASLLCGSFFSITCLVIIFFEQNGRKISLKNSFLNKIYTFYFGKIKKITVKQNFLQKFFFFNIKNFYKYQLIQQLDYWSFCVIRLGFFFLTIGIISGSIWANEAWGSYWQWDPKETWSFITWIIFMIYLHLQNIKLKDSIISSIMGFMGFIIIWICYFGVNILEIGMHSYGYIT